MVKIIWLLFCTIYLFASEHEKKEGYTLTDMNVREKATIQSKIIDKVKYKEKIEIVDVVYDDKGDYWYKTKYGFMYGPSITTDVRFVKADLLHIRLKPSLKGTELSYFLDGDKVIVIRKAGFLDGYNWVLTTEGYVSSDYLTKTLVKEIDNEKIIAKKITFYEQPNKNAPLKKTVKKEDVEFVVKEAIKIDPSKSKEEIKQEQILAVKNNKILSKNKIKQTSKYIMPITKHDDKVQTKSNKYALDKNDDIQEVYQISLSSLSVYYGGEYNHYKRKNDIGKKLQNTTQNIAFSMDFSYTVYDKSFAIYTTYEKSKYSLREKENKIIGLKKYLLLTHKKRFYLLAGVGSSKLIWEEDPLSGSVVQDKSSTNRLAELGFGWEYQLSSHIYADILFKESYSNHTTELSYITKEDTVNDKYTTKLLFGLGYKF
jgi:hypothetical protein